MFPHHLNTNRKFLIGNIILVVGLIVVVLVFLYMSFRFRRNAPTSTTVMQTYTFVFDKTLVGDSLTLYFNDSLVWDKTLPEAIQHLEVGVPADASLLFVENHTKHYTAPLNVDAKQRSYLLQATADGLQLVPLP